MATNRRQRTPRKGEEDFILSCHNLILTVSSKILYRYGFPNEWRYDLTAHIEQKLLLVFREHPKECMDRPYHRTVINNAAREWISALTAKKRDVTVAVDLTPLVQEQDESDFNDPQECQSEALSADPWVGVDAKIAINQLLPKLDEQHRQVLCLVFGIGVEEEISVAGIADLMKISRDKARRLKDEAIYILQQNRVF